MNSNNCLSVAAGQRSVQHDVFAAFDDIAQICLKLARSGQGSVRPLQDYLDGLIRIGGVCLRRRMFLLSIHDMESDREAPRLLQRKVLAQAFALQMHPIPKLSLYRDIATALLRMEVVIRLAPAKEPKPLTARPVIAAIPLPPVALPPIPLPSVPLPPIPLPSVPLRQWGADVRQRVQPSLAIMATYAAALQASLAGLRAPRLLPLTSGALRYNWASGIRAVISL